MTADASAAGLPGLLTGGGMPASGSAGTVHLLAVTHHLMYAAAMGMLTLLLQFSPRFNMFWSWECSTCKLQRCHKQSCNFAALLLYRGCCSSVLRYYVRQQA